MVMILDEKPNVDEILRAPSCALPLRLTTRVVTLVSSNLQAAVLYVVMEKKDMSSQQNGKKQQQASM